MSGLNIDEYARGLVFLIGVPGTITALTIFAFRELVILSGARWDAVPVQVLVLLAAILAGVAAHHVARLAAR